MPSVIYDIAIIGAGASGLQLLYESLQADSTKEMKILLLDSGDRSSKSWCFWEDHQHACFPFLVEKSWDKMAYVSTKGKTIQTDISPLKYQYISSDRFFTYFFNELIPHDPRVTHLKKWVTATTEASAFNTVHCEGGDTFYARKIADSRPKKSLDSKLIYQHFSGKFIDFEQPILDESCLTLMDFSLATSTKEMAVFHYILPFRKTKAIIETTVFTQLPYDAQVYEAIWQQYMHSHYSQAYKVISSENGTIPMGFHVDTNTEHVFQIGAAGGFMKASTGYAFTRMHQDAINRAQNRFNKVPNRFRFYDTLLLKIMKNEMNRIPDVMDRLFSRVPTKRILQFLDDKTTLGQEIRLLAQLDVPLFLKHLFR
jgi:lycopene beta-cyclase